MVRLTALFVATAITMSDAFVPATTTPLQRSATTCKQPSTTSLDAAPTMFIYWSIKTAMDTIAYGLGQTDEVKGTGVWGAFKLKREESDDDDEKKED